MEAIAVILILLFVVAPLPLCLFLLVQRKKLVERVEKLEHEVRTAPAQSASKPEAVKETVTPKIVFTEEPPKAEAPPEPVKSVAKVVTPEPVKKQPTPFLPSAKPAEPKPGITDFLGSFGLLPPADLERKEAGIIQWWTLRIAGILAVLTIVFASVYFSKNTQPIFRFLGILAADLGVIGLGVFFWKRRPGFASILLSIGFSMLYVSMVAGYAAPPVRVFTNPFVGFAFQFATIALIYGVSIYLKERGIALLATVFGFVSSIFSAYVGLNEGALLSALALQIAGLAYGYRWKFAPLAAISTIGVYLPVISFCGLAVIQSKTFTLPYQTSVLAFLAIAVSALPFMALKAQIDSLFAKQLWRLLVIANTSLCGLVGYSYFKLTGGELVQLYGVLAIVFLAWASLFSRTGLRSLLFQLYFLKGSGFAALWIANYFTGEVRWFALAIQCVLVAWSTRQSKSIWSEVANGVLWIAAIWLALGDLPNDSSLEAWSVKWLLFAIFPIMGLLAGALQLEALNPHKSRFPLYNAFGLLSGILSAVVVSKSSISDTQTAIFLAGFAVVFAAVSRLPKLAAKSLLVAAGTTLFLGHIAFWNSPQSITAFVALVGITTAFAFAAAKKLGTYKPKKANLAEYALVLLSIISIYAYFSSEYGENAWFALLAPVLAIALRVFRIRPFRTFADASFLPLLLDLTFHIDSEQSIVLRTLNLCLYVLFLALPVIRPSWERNFSYLRKGGIGRKIAHSLVAFLFFSNSQAVDNWLPTNLFLIGGVIAFFALWKLHRHRIALFASCVFVFLVLLSVFGQYESYNDQSPWSWELLLVGGLLTTCAISMGAVLSLGRVRRVGSRNLTLLVYALAIVSYLSVAFSLAYPGLSLNSYYTPAVALFSMIFIVLGIALKIRPYRFVALASLLLPLGRLFIYDIQETLNRIIAFAVLAVLLTAIGYLYSRFAGRID